MQRYHNIVAGYDGSPCSRKAILEAMRIAGWSVTPLWIYRAIDRHDLAEIASATLMQEAEILRTQERRDNRAIEAVAEDLVETEWHLRVLPGDDPAVLLVDEAEKGTTNLIVIGSHGHSHEECGAVGTFARKLLRKAPCDVLLVREVQVGGFKHVVALLGNGGAEDLEVLQRASDIAAHEDATLEILSCYPAGWSRHLLGDNDPDKVKARVAEGLAIRKQNLDSLIASAGNGGPAPSVNVLSSESPSTALLESLNELGADLVVISDHLSSDRPDVERVVAETRCSVLMVADED